MPARGPGRASYLLGRPSGPPPDVRPRSDDLTAPISRRGIPTVAGGPAQRPAMTRRMNGEHEMPRILVTTEPPTQVDASVLLSERIAPDDLASDHFAAQLIERIGWALLDADTSEGRRAR